MSVRLAFEGTFERDPQKGYVFKGTEGKGGELTGITSLSMGLAFETGTSHSEVGALRIELGRDASQGVPEDLLASRYQFGQQNQGEQWVFPAELWLIDDAHPAGASCVTVFKLHQTQVMRAEPDDADAPPREQVRLHSYEWEVANMAGEPKAISTNQDLVPVCATGVKPLPGGVA